MPNKIFISYSHADVKFFAELKEQLTPLETQGALDVWDDTRIRAGSLWNDEVQQSLASTKIAVLLISPSFLASEYVQSSELPSLLAAAQTAGVLIVPLFVRPSVVDSASFTFQDPVTGTKHKLQLTVFQGLNGPEKTLSEMDPSRRARLLATLAAKLVELEGQANQVRPNKTDATKRAGVLIDMSHHQNDWEYLEDFLRDGRGSREPLPGARVVLQSGGPVWGAGSVRVLRRSPSDPNGLADAAVLIMAMPRRCLLSPAEVEQIRSWVWSGGGLLLLGFYAADSHHGSNPSSLARVFGYEFGDDLVMPEVKSSEYYCRAQVFSLNPDFAVRISPVNGTSHPIVDGVGEVAFLSSCSVRPIDAHGSYQLLTSSDTPVWVPSGPKDSQGWRKIIVQWTLERQGGATVLAASQHGHGKVVVAGTWKLLTLEFLDNVTLVRNIFSWLMT